jgi:hypothetical protein
MLCHQLRKPAAKALVRGAILREPCARPYLRTHDGISEERGRRQHDGEEGIFEIAFRRPPRRHAPCVHKVGHGTHDANACARRGVAEPGEDKPCHEARVPAVAERFEDAIEQCRAVDVIPGVREPPHEVRLERGERSRGDRPHQPFPTAEVVENRGVRNAHVGSDVLKPQGVGTSGKEPLFRGVQDGSLRLFCRPPSPGRAPLAGSRRNGA